MTITQLATVCLATELLHRVNSAISFVCMLASGTIKYIFLVLGGIPSCSYVKGIWSQCTRFWQVRHNFSILLWVLMLLSSEISCIYCFISVFELLNKISSWLWFKWKTVTVLGILGVVAVSMWVLMSWPKTYLWWLCYPIWWLLVQIEICCRYIIGTGFQT